MSAVWKYFKVCEENDAVANCQICKVGISRGGKDKASFNTTNLIRHLKNKHRVSDRDSVSADTQKSKDSDSDRGQKTLIGASLLVL